MLFVVFENNNRSRAWDVGRLGGYIYIHTYIYVCVRMDDEEEEEEIGR